MKVRELSSKRSVIFAIVAIAVIVFTLVFIAPFNGQKAMPVDDNSTTGTGYGSINNPTPVVSLATDAETGEPISSEPNGPWEGPQD